MKKTGIILVLFLGSFFSKAMDLQVYYYYAPFYSSEVGTYIETYLTAVGNSAAFVKNENGKYQAKVEVTMLFKQDGVIKDFRKYNLSSPEVEDTLNKPNFIDVQRINLKEGSYNFEMKVKDIQSPSSKEFVFHDIITLNYKPDVIEISGIEFLEKYTPTIQANTLSRNGFDMVPYVADFYPSSLKNFIFYLEIYNTKKVLGDGQEFLLQYYIENTNLLVPISAFARTKKQKTADVIPLLSEFSIEGLETGNYNFVVEIRNKENKVIATRKIFFQRSNPKPNINWKKVQEIVIEQTFVEDISSKDSLREYIKCLYPISDGVEYEYAQNALKADSMSYLRKYFYSFWKIRNNLDPESEWKKYKEQVNYVNRMYGSQVKKGYESDRGRVYLQYGAPNNTVRSVFSNETYPYEIWHYYVINDQRNKRFVFYNPELSGKDFLLLHSDVRGEISTVNWQAKIGNPNSTVDPSRDMNEWKSRLNEDYQK